MEELNSGKISTIFESKLDIQSGFGIFGHSFGGATALKVVMEDSRFTCGLNLDGGPYGGGEMDEKLNKPFMFITQPRFEFLNSYFKIK